MQVKNNNKNQLDIWVSQKSHRISPNGSRQIQLIRKAVYQFLKRVGQEHSLIGILIKKGH